MIGLIIALALVGLVLYLIETYIPMDPVIKTVIRIVIVVCVILYLIQVFGIADLPLPRLNR
jgi:hypothetical protein